MSAADILTPAQRDAVARWKRGHHMFHLLLVTMTTRLDEACEAVDREDWPTVTEALTDLAGMYDSATATMRYTADFPRLEYERLIRVSMMPPYTSNGFSGVHNTEHAAMIRGLRRLRSAVSARRLEAPPPVLEAWARLRDAQGVNRRSHMLVCRQFVDTGVSLLQEFYSDADALSLETRVEEVVR
jgi:hypothetical protein